MNKSIEGTADDEEEGVSPDTAIRSGLELLKVFFKLNLGVRMVNKITQVSGVQFYNTSSVFVLCIYLPIFV